MGYVWPFYNKLRSSIDPGYTCAGHQQSDYQGKKADQSRFAQELRDQLAAVATQYFSNTNLFCTVNRLRGAKVDKVYAGYYQ